MKTPVKITLAVSVMAILGTTIVIYTTSKSRTSEFTREDVFSKLKLVELSSEQVANALDENDSDRDGIIDSYEIIIGTDPLNHDTDGDALLDGWEMGKVNGIDLRSSGASPLHKDIFIWMDYMVNNNKSNGIGPNQFVIDHIVNSFNQAPVVNLDGKDGIKLHLFMGNEVEYDPDLNPVFIQFGNIKRKYFDPKKAPIFHYMLWADSYNSSTSSGISLDIPSSDFIVSLGRWNNSRGGTDQEKIGTFIHELGHNLGLRHGNIDDENWKPNHLSVMNYFYQMSGLKRNEDGNPVYLYSYQECILPELYEDNLNEEVGLGADKKINKIYARYRDNNRRMIEIEAGKGMDWNQNSVIDVNTIRYDFDQNNIFDLLLSTPNEWEKLIFNAGLIGYDDLLSGAIDSSINEFRELPFTELDEATYFQFIQNISN